MKILVAGDFRWHNGSSHVIQEYVKVGPTLGMDFAVATDFGSHDQQVTQYLPFCNSLSWASHLLVVYETRPFLSTKDLRKIDEIIPRSRRAVIDADGHWASAVKAGNDSNAWPCGNRLWKKHINAVSDLVLQPTIGEPYEEAVRFSYHGMPAPLRRKKRASQEWASDLQYVGSNWFRFDSAVDIFSAARESLGPSAKLRLRGTFWDESVCDGFEEATESDVTVWQALGVEIDGPVPFGQVVEEMSEALITPVLVRPILTKLGLLTPRMFETVAAETIPVYRWDDRQIARLYEDDLSLCIGREPKDLLKRIVENPVLFQQKALSIRERLQAKYSYTEVLKHLKMLLAC